MKWDIPEISSDYRNGAKMFQHTTENKNKIIICKIVATIT
jgi:hypothetical protein